jgi:hypothetical protein
MVTLSDGADAATKGVAEKKSTKKAPVVKTVTKPKAKKK